MFEKAYEMHLRNIKNKGTMEAYRDAIAGLENIAYGWVSERNYQQVAAQAADASGVTTASHVTFDMKLTAEAEQAMMHTNLQQFVMTLPA